jgi:hypothetical protein
MKNHFYNSVDITGVSLQLEEQNALSLEKEILYLFKTFSEYTFRTYDIEHLLAKHFIRHNHDSVKRSISNLTKDGKLTKSEKAECPGPYHLKVNVWQFKSQSEEIAA